MRIVNSLHENPFVQDIVNYSGNGWRCQYSYVLLESWFLTFKLMLKGGGRMCLQKLLKEENEKYT